MSLSSDPVLTTALALSRAGVACHWLWPRTKKPILDSWSDAPFATPEQLQSTYRPNYNLGIRPGKFSCVDGLYLHIFDIDVRDETKTKEAYGWLDEHWPEWRSGFPTVQSGSGGSSRHVYFFLRAPYRSRMVARSNEHVMYHDRKVWAWQLEIYGSFKQVAAPPSVHPDTGLPYKWLRPIDFDAIELGCAPLLDEDLIKSWKREPESRPAEPNDNRLGLTPDEARSILSKLPLDEFCEDRNGWLKVGLALNHEFGDEGFDLWNEFSQQSDKFNEEDSQRVWKSFRSGTSTPLRMATLKQAVRAVEIAEMFEDLPDEPQQNTTESDEDDLLGPSDYREPSLSKASASTNAEIGVRISGLPTKPAVEWASKLDLNDEGGIRPTLHNVTLIVRNDPRTHSLMHLNQFTQEVVQRGQPGFYKLKKDSPKGTKQLTSSSWHLKDTTNGDLWTEDKDNAIRDVLEAPRRQGGYGFRITDRDLKAAIDIVARENAFHPVREYIESTEWDGTPRLETLFIRYLGAPDCPYSRQIAKFVLLAGVTRIYEPGAKFDFALILEGMQGKRKSTFISLLAHHWFAELNCDFSDSRQIIEMTQGAWILEIPELSGFNKSDVRVIKGFISRTVDKGRLAYARRAQNFPRQCIFIGSTNDREYLRDDTGGRRFWPLECRVDEIDTDSFEQEVDQLWAEAYTMYRAIRTQQPRGTLPLYLTDASARSTALELQESRRIENADDMLSGEIEAWLDRPIIDESGFNDLDDLLGPPMRRNETCLIQIWVECLGRDKASYIQSPQVTQSLGRAMKRIAGWSNIGPRHTRKFGTARVYRRDGFEPLDGGQTL